MEFQIDHNDLLINSEISEDSFLTGTGSNVPKHIVLENNVDT